VARVAVGKVRVGKGLVAVAAVAAAMRAMVVAVAEVQSREDTTAPLGATSEADLGVARAKVVALVQGLGSMVADARVARVVAMEAVVMAAALRGAVWKAAAAMVVCWEAAVASMAAC